MSAALKADVRAVESAPIGTGQTGATYRLTVGYAADDASLPRTFAVKLPSQDETVRERVALGYRSEHAFYTHIADVVKVPIPKHFYCDISADGGDIVLLLADMAPAVQGDQIGGCDAVEAELAARAIAGLHGPTWCDPKWANFPGLAMSMPNDDAAKGLGDVAVMATQITLDRLGARDDRTEPRNGHGVNGSGDAVAAGRTRPVLADARRLPARQPAVHPRPDRHHRRRLADAGSGPARARPRLLHRDEPAPGPAGRTRRAVGRPPTTTSCCSYGITDYDRETCWRDYRLGMLQAPLITTLGCAFASTTERGDEMMLVMLERGCQAIRELGSLDLIAAS